MVKIDPSLLLFLLLGSILIRLFIGCASVCCPKTEEIHSKSQTALTRTAISEDISETSSTGKSWHHVVWSFSLSVGASFSLFDFLLLLHDNSDKLNDDLDTIFTSETIRNVRNRICRILLKLRKKLSCMLNTSARHHRHAPQQAFKKQPLTHISGSLAKAKRLRS